MTERITDPKKETPIDILAHPSPSPALTNIQVLGNQDDAGRRGIDGLTRSVEENSDGTNHSCATGGAVTGNSVAGITAPSCPARRIVLFAIRAADPLKTHSGLRDLSSRFYHALRRIINAAPAGKNPHPDTSPIGLIVAAGDILRLARNGEIGEYRVSETMPEGPVVVDGSTAVIFTNSAGLSAYQNVGGLDKEIARVREMVELPLRAPHLFRQLGIDPPKGLLLYGPPGCGKTLIARTVAQGTGAYFISVSGPEIIQKHYGESEELLRQIFADAEKNAPAIIFFDEIDAVAPNRETVLGDVEKRVVAQLLSLMDGVRSRGQIVVIAATNLPNAVDPALRRPGRFDREIAINPPGKPGRLDILRIHTRPMPLDKDVDLDRLASLTHGFLGADLAALCREAAMTCIREISRDFTPGEITGTVLSVSMRHFKQALGEITLSSIRQMSTAVNDVKWEDVGGLDPIRQLLQETVEWPLRYGRRFTYAGTTPPKGILLTGRPGTGKTFIVDALASETEINFINAKGPELLSKWVGESERGIRELFKRAKQSAPCILFFDEIDAIAPIRGQGDSGAQINERMVGQLLLEMDNMASQEGVVILAATNRPELIDQALLRPGRFDFVVDLPMPDQAARLAILQSHCRHRPVDPNVDIGGLAARTANMTGADLQSLCQRAALLAIRQSVSTCPGPDFPAFTIDSEHFELALLEMTQDNPG